MRQIIIDENIPRNAGEWLAKNSFEIINVSEILPRRAKDYTIAEYAAKHGIAIITLDKGFAKIYRTFQTGTLTIIILRANPATTANIIEALNVTQQKINLGEIQNKLVIISKKRIRIIS